MSGMPSANLLPEQRWEKDRSKSFLLSLLISENQAEQREFLLTGGASGSWALLETICHERHEYSIHSGADSHPSLACDKHEGQGGTSCLFSLSTWLYFRQWDGNKSYPNGFWKAGEDLTVGSQMTVSNAKWMPFV